MIISISGVPGSGKTSVGKLLAKRLGYNFYSMGGLRGKMALERGIMIDQLNTIGESDPTTDTTVDDYQRELGKKEDHFVIEGRLSWHFIPHSFKVLLQCDPAEAARRIFEARKRASEGRDDEPAYATVEEALAQIERRTASDMARYDKYYGLNYRDPAHYDLALDTTRIQGIEAVTDAIQQALPKVRPA